MQGRVAFLPSVPVRLKYLKPKEPEVEPVTFCEHLRRCRQARNLTQKALAKLLHVDGATVLHWERGRTKPPIGAMRRLLRFLGYDPSPEPRTLPERLLAKRRAMGWSIKTAAGHLALDPSTWSDWEKGKVILFRKHRARVDRLLGLPIADVKRDMRGRWGRLHQKGV